MQKASRRPTSVRRDSAQTNFVADNGTAAGRQQNRRVNLVVSGDAIGVQTQPEGEPGAAAAPAANPAPAPPQNPTGVSNPQ